MGARRDSLRPSVPPLAQRVLTTAVVLFFVGSLVCLHEVTSSDWVGAPAILTSHLRSAVEVAIPLEAVSRLQTGQRPSAWREFFQQRASMLNEDQTQVVEMAKYAWQAYHQHGNWSDALDVLNQTGATTYDHDMAYTAVDSLDTLLVMGLHDEFDEASDWIKSHLHDRMFVSGNVSFYESTVRSLGGLLSAYYLSGETHLLELASKLAERLEKDFTCGIFVPCQHIDLTTGGFGTPLLAEAATFQLEFRYLSNLTDRQIYADLVDNINALSTDLTRDFYTDGLVPVSINWETITGVSSNVSFGALGGSYYEYLLKQWILGGKKDDTMKQSYLTAVEGLKATMVGRSQYTFIGLLQANGKLEPRMDHESCFVPGMLALGTLHGLPNDHLQLAEELIETCVQMYLRSQSKLAPEVVHFNEPSDSSQAATDFVVLEADDYNLLRPETVESLMVLYRVTKDPKYRQYGRQIMQAFDEQAKVPTGGYRSTQRVFSGPIEPRGATMESAFLSETLKYLFLLFSEDDVLPLDAVVFSTAAHPFPIVSSSRSSAV